MDSGDRSQRSNFQLEGQFLGGLPDKHGFLKCLKLSTASGVYWIKLAKPLRRSPLVANLDYRSEVRVTGQQIRDTQNGKIKLKAFNLETKPAEVRLLAPTDVAARPTPTQVLICTKSSCQKRGAAALCAALQQGLSQRHLTEQVQIVKTGCMKACKAGPHIVVKPDRMRYTHSRLSTVAALFERHFTAHSPHLSPAADQPTINAYPDASSPPLAG
ncbi:MAG: (2Fe-2S) ferredoxin domain-containing protein [Thermosynechococcaceae cyanobacterium]